MSTATFMNGTHDFASPGTYPVQLIAQNECGSDTLIVNVQIAVSGIQSLNEDLYTIATKGNGIFQLRFENALQLSNLQVFSIEGKELKLRYSFVNEKELELDLSNEKPGIYFLNFFGRDKRYNQKLYK
jgi:hypothetical protein